MDDSRLLAELGLASIGEAVGATFSSFIDVTSQPLSLQGTKATALQCISPLHPELPKRRKPSFL